MMDQTTGKRPGSSLDAVFNSHQLERFCRRFDLDPSELEVNLLGWHKLCVLGKEAVYLLPRTPPNARALERELTFYGRFSERFAREGCPALPRLIARVKDPEICCYEIGVLTRLPGIPFARCMEDLSPERREGFLLDLTELVAAWHGVPAESAEPGLAPGRKAAATRVSLANWHRHLLRPERVGAAVDFIYGFLRKSHRRLGCGALPDPLGEPLSVCRQWTTVLMEIAEMPHVLVHGDVHEGHVLVQPGSLSITGIVDWETARVDNPVWDFNFGEWGTGICAWWGDLLALRRAMWSRYLAARGIQLESREGLNLFYTLWELVWLVHARRTDGHIVTGTDYATAVSEYARKLAAVTAML
jgi:hypothetical protein